MIEYQQQLYNHYYHKHRNKVTNHIFWICTIFLIISCTWNTIFLLFDLPYSRADVAPFLACLGLLLVYKSVSRKVKLRSEWKQAFMLFFCGLLFIVAYFSSGFSESWSFILLMPLIAGIYGERKILIFYSIIGLIVLSTLSINYPTDILRIDSIDISNRILVYTILAALSYTVLKTVQRLYSGQVTLVIEMMEKTVEDVVNSFVTSVEAKDQYTFGHSKRVSEYAVALAKLLPDYGVEDLKRIRWSCLVHDIGKINVPETILQKTGELTKEEFDIIKTHPVVGAKMVGKIDGLQYLKNGVLYHHERWDGKGYPAKIKGEEIPLDARVIAVADAFDAMTSTRSYRSELSLEEAFQRINSGSGSQFDPELVDLLNREAKEDFIRINKEMNDEISEFETLTDLL
ncbi:MULTISPECIES: HD-GYP domain-containing protein [Bacillaceae]|uniref:HD-GYP domain-containing protein n=1 Tax=Evansella alkalicola TaxID=745819 RepID=A0ABS6JUL9_9BACI|nr:MULTISPECIES: HD-GYP domain-containing protein [Bacillaceae]MBU9721957.1 HD-GYP domain-containing protein [Bacillus alkalicola]